MNIPQANDRTRNAIAYNRITDSLRPLPGGAFPVGTVLQYVAQDNQAFPDYATVQPSPATARSTKLAGVVSEEFAASNRGGFDGLGATTAGGAAARGSQDVIGTVYGYHGAVLIDNTNGQTITDGIALSTSSSTAGRAMGDTAPVVGRYLGYAALPAAGIGSSLGAGALVAASQTITIAGTPQTGDVVSVTLQVPYVVGAPGVAQTRTILVGPLTAAQATNVTTAAAAVVAAINADPVFKTFYLAANVAGVVTVTVVAAPFSVFFANAFNPAVTGLPFVPTAFQITTAGTVGNSLTIATAAVIVGNNITSTAGAANFAAGAGFIGSAPAFIRTLL